MSLRLTVTAPLEQAYLRNALFALELIDAVTLARVSDGVEVAAEGLAERPIVNSSGLFVWRGPSVDALQHVRITPGLRPYEPRVIPRAALNLPPSPIPLTTVQLAPRADYPFAAGTTGARGQLVESDTGPIVPVSGASIALRWLDDDGTTWREAPIETPTSAGGDFHSVLRLAPLDVPLVDAAGALSVRVRVRRDGVTRFSSVVKLTQGRLADQSTLASLRLAWDALQP